MNTTLVSELKAIVGERYVLTQPADLLAYSYDSALDRAVPLLVVLPGTPPELTQVVKILAHHKQAYVARGAGTSLCGAPIPINTIAVIGLARLKRIGQLDKVKRQITVEPGVVNLKLQQAVEKDGFMYAPDPGSQKACTIGGNVALNAGGPHCLKYGVTSNHVVGLDLVLPDGHFLRVSVDDPGYDLTGFFVGSEGTLGIASHIRLNLLPKPKFVRTAVVSFHTMEEAIQSVADIIAAGILPATLEAMDKTIVAAVESFIHAGYPLEAEAVLLIEVDGDDPASLDYQMTGIEKICNSNNSFDLRVAKDEEERQRLWEGRRGSYAAMARLAPNVLVEDGAVPRTVLPQALQRIKDIAAEHDLQVALLFHAGDGNLHPQIIFDERDPNQTANVKAAGMKMLKACVDLGGSISGEHGIGIDKREAMRWLFNRETLSLFRRLKVAFDPLNLSNPEKLLPIVGKIQERLDTDVPGLDQVAFSESAAPSSEEEAVKRVKKWSAERKSFGIQGSKTKLTVRENPTLSTVQLNRIKDFDTGNLTLTVQAGAVLPTVRAEVERHGQFLWMAGEGTVGGAIATRSSAQPPVRDLILGMTLLLPTGEVVKLGAKTMKNVAGYDVAKLLIGSWGTLAVILDVTLRLFPMPAAKLKTAKTQPFVLSDLHKRIKAAFDPKSLLSPSLSNLTKLDLEKAPVDAPPAPSGESDHFDKSFWT